MASVSIRAYAKLNLSLTVGPRRPDGYHELRTVYQTIDLADALRFRTRRGPFAIATSMPGVPVDRRNLIWQAAAAMWQAAGRPGDPHGVEVQLRKRIPPQAGLGGGSSNAAAALIALRRLWQVRLADADLVAAAAALGSDVPFFLTGGTALGVERGEEVYPLQELPAWPVVVLLYPFGVSTGDAYAWFDDGEERRPAGAARPRHLGSIALINDLQAPVLERHPALAAGLRRLERHGAWHAAMSGSGSAIFGLFATPRAAAAAARGLAGELDGDGVRAVAARFVSRRAAGRLPAAPSIG